VNAPGQAGAELSRVGAMALVRAQHARRGTSSGVDAACELVLTRLSEQLGQARRVASEPHPAPLCTSQRSWRAVVAELESIRLGPEAPKNP
jgi:hypothetical protein